MKIISKYFIHITDYTNLEKTCKKYNGIIETYKHNPISFNNLKEMEIFKNVEVYHFYQTERTEHLIPEESEGSPLELFAWFLTSTERSDSPFNDTEDPVTEIKSNEPLNNETMTNEQLDEFEERLNLLEHSLNKQEQDIEQLRTSNSYEQVPNWPKFYPMFYYNIEEVPENLRGFVHDAFFSYFFMVITYLINWIGTLCLLRIEDTIDSPGSKIALSSLYLFVIIPLLFDFDTIAVYKVLSTNASTFQYIKLFLALGLTCIFETILALGLESSGSLGLISSIELLSKKHISIGVFGIIITMFLFICVFFCYCCCTISKRTHARLIDELDEQ